VYQFCSQIYTVDNINLSGQKKKNTQTDETTRMKNTLKPHQFCINQLLIKNHGLKVGIVKECHLGFF